MSKKVRECTDAEIESNWNGIWKEILQREDGSINVEQLKKELMDFSGMIGRLTSLTCQLTRGRLSYPTYPTSTIMVIKEEVDQEEYEQQQKDDIEDGVCSMCGHELESGSDDSERDIISN